MTLADRVRNHEALMGGPSCLHRKRLHRLSMTFRNFLPPNIFQELQSSLIAKPFSSPLYDISAATGLARIADSIMPKHTLFEQTLSLFRADMGLTKHFISDIAGTQKTLRASMAGFIDPLDAIGRSFAPLTEAVRMMNAHINAIIPPADLFAKFYGFELPSEILRTDAIVGSLTRILKQVSLDEHFRFPHATPRLLAAARILEIGRTKRASHRAAKKRPYRFSPRTTTAMILVADQHDVPESASENVKLIQNISAALEEAHADDAEIPSSTLASLKAYAHAWYLGAVHSAQSTLQRLELQQLIGVVFLAIGLSSANVRELGNHTFAASSAPSISQSLSIPTGLARVQDETARLSEDLQTMSYVTSEHDEDRGTIVEVVYRTKLQKRAKSDASVIAELQAGEFGSRLEEDGEWIRLGVVDLVTNERISGWTLKKYTRRVK